MCHSQLESRPVVACEQEHREPPAATICAVMMRSGDNMAATTELLGGVFLCWFPSFCWNIRLVICRNLLSVSNFSKYYICIVVSFFKAYRDTYRQPIVTDAPILRWIVSPLSYNIWFSHRRDPRYSFQEDEHCCGLTSNEQSDPTLRVVSSYILSRGLSTDSAPSRSMSSSL